MNINFEEVLPKYHALLDRGLCAGKGNPGGQMCIEAVWCAVLGLPHGDDPECVASAVREYKIALNDARWSSPHARAEGMRRLGIAQIGSLGVVLDTDFTQIMQEKTIRRLIPELFREVCSTDACLAAADRCEKEGTREAASAAARARAAWAAESWAAAAAAESAWAEWAAARAARAGAAAAAAVQSDKYLIMSANLAIEALTELGSPGVKWMDWGRR